MLYKNDRPWATRSGVKSRFGCFYGNICCLLVVMTTLLAMVTLCSQRREAQRNVGPGMDLINRVAGVSLAEGRRSAYDIYMARTWTAKMGNVTLMEKTTNRPVLPLTSLAVLQGVKRGQRVIVIPTRVVL